MTEKADSSAFSNILCRWSIAGGRNDKTARGFVMTDGGMGFLYGLNPNRLGPLFALDDKSLAIFLCNNVGSEVPGLFGKSSTPSVIF